MPSENNILPKKITILIVDDEEIIRNLLDSFLKRQGHRSIVAPNGEAAINFAGKENPDLVLLDIKMPDMDGHQVCQRLRELPSSSHPMGIIMITGYGSLNNKEKAIESGADDLIEKPLDLYELVYRIKVWLDVKDLRDQIEKAAVYAYRIRQYKK
ncbi:MAG: response regulator [Candidatus Omnitrophota bacterium]